MSYYIEFKRCGTCGGDLTLGVDEWSCFQCGRNYLYQAPSPGTTTGPSGYSTSNVHREEIMRTAVDIQVDEYTAIKKTEKTIRDGAMNYGKSEIIIGTGYSNKSLRSVAVTLVVGVSVGLAFVLVGAIFVLAART